MHLAEVRLFGDPAAVEHLAALLAPWLDETIRADLGDDGAVIYGTATIELPL